MTAGAPTVPGRGHRVVLVLAAGWVVASAVAALTSPLSTPLLVVRSISGGAFVAAGAVLWARRSAVALGWLFLACGLALCLTNLSLFPGVFWAAVRVLSGGYAPFGVLLGHLLLAYPSGRLTDRLSRVSLTALYTLTAGYMLCQYAVGTSAGERFCAPAGCPGLPPVWVASDAAARAVVVVLGSCYPVGLVLLLVALVRRWRAAPPATRRSLRMVMISLIAACALGVASLAIRVGGLSGDGLLRVVLATAGASTATAVALGLLAAAVRGRLFAYGMGDLAARLEPGTPAEQIQLVLARVLGDPTVQLVRFLPAAGCYVDVDGRPVESLRGRTWVPVGRPPVGALVFDAALSPSPRVVEGLVGAIHLVLENLALQERLRDQLVDLQESRSRIALAADEERRRIERDLHDGAQQRIIGSALTVRRARTAVRTDPGEADVLLSRAEHELRAALHEIRDLAHGLHPAVLTDCGLGAAVESLAERLPIDVEVADGLTTRPPLPLETTAYFVVCEALVNATRHSSADVAWVRLQPGPDSLVVEIADNGAGGARAVAGSGLAGLQDRVSAVGGSLSVDSPAGRGTTVRAELPWPGALRVLPGREGPA